MVLKIGVLGSTNGSDLPAVVESIQRGELQGLAEIAVVISDKEDSGILEKARGYDLNNVYINPRGDDGKRKDREVYDREVAEILNREKIELVMLIGYMKLMSPWFVGGEFKNKCMNIHPSLLPAYAGGMDLNVHEEVLDRGCKVTGCSLIYIDEGADTGPIILQRAVPRLDGDTPETLKARVQEAEQTVLIEAIKLYAQGRLSVEGNRVHIQDYDTAICNGI